MEDQGFRPVSRVLSESTWDPNLTSNTEHVQGTLEKLATVFADRL